MALNLVAKVHPVVFFAIVDSYERRNLDAHRVIGTLLGNYISYMLGFCLFNFPSIKLIYN